MFVQRMMACGLALGLGLMMAGCNQNPPLDAGGGNASGVDAAASGDASGEGATKKGVDYQWPEPPDQMATISGHWSIDGGGELYFSSETKTDDIGFRYHPGTYVTADGKAIEFRWETWQSGFDQSADGHFQTLIGIVADMELPFAKESETYLRFKPNDYRAGTLWIFESPDSLDTIEHKITKVDDKQAP